jgi:DNA-directed RNA polymerase specialized sigma24 family protein
MRFPQMAEVTPHQALAMVANPYSAMAWAEKVGVPWSPAVIVALHELADAARVADDQQRTDARGSAANRRRRDVGRITSFMERAATRLPRRLEEVYELCINRGQSLDQAAAALGISRNTVRTHLRRIRGYARRSAVRSATAGTPR